MDGGGANRDGVHEAVGHVQCHDLFGINLEQQELFEFIELVVAQGGGWNGHAMEPERWGNKRYFR